MVKQQEINKALEVVANKLFVFTALLLLVCTMCITSCKSKRKNALYDTVPKKVLLSNEKDLSDKLSKEKLEKILRDVALFQFPKNTISNLSSNMKVNFSALKGNNLSFKLYAQSDMKDIMLLRAQIFGFEAGKVLLTKDSIFIHSKFERLLYYGSFHSDNAMLDSSMIVKFLSSMKNILLTRSLLDYLQPVKIVYLSQQNDSVGFLSQNSKFSFYDVWVKNMDNNYQLSSSEIVLNKDFSNTTSIPSFNAEKKILKIEYRSLSQTQLKNFTYFSNLKVKVDNGDLAINIKKINVNAEKFSLNAKFPKGLKRVALGELLKKVDIR